MTKKLLAIFLAISMALSFSACGGEKNNGDSSTAEVTTTTTSESTAEMKTIEPPADGWTPELLNQVMYLNGKPFSLPCTLKDLGNEYSFSKDIIDWKDGTGRCTCELLYNKEIVATIEINNYSDSKGISDDTKIVSMLFGRAIISNLKNGFDIKKCSINGIFLDSTEEEITQRMGNINLYMFDDGYYSYYYKDKNKPLVKFMFGGESEDLLDTIIIANF